MNARTSERTSMMLLKLQKTHIEKCSTHLEVWMGVLGRCNFAAVQVYTYRE